MRTFDDNIIDVLNHECSSDDVHYVGLGKYDFQLSFGYLRLQTYHKAGFYLSGQLGIWEQGPSEIPVWKLVEQTPSSFELINPLTLRLNLASGDYVEFHSDEAPYEAVLIEKTSNSDADFMEVY
jgi:hypothetical protein